MATKKKTAKRTSAKRVAPKKLLQSKKPSMKVAKKPAIARPTAPKKPAKPQGANKITEGARAPSFGLADQDGRVVTSSEFAGKAYVLYFYPKDDTPGCTREACGFRDASGKLAKAGVRVIGVSPDKVTAHARFSTKYGLNFTLLADEEKKLARAYGVWVMKKNYGRQYEGIERSTFLVDASGTVRKLWRGVRVDGHVEQVLGATQDL
jgi:peroxiredoxin Q/BCP